MAVPKKRTGHSAQGSRRSNWKATKPETTKCPNCGETVLTHTVCTACGTYKGKPVSLKDRVEDKKRNVSYLPKVVNSEYKSMVENYIALCQGHLDDALAFICKVPTTEYGIRLFCLLNIAMATATLKLISKSDLFDEKKPKITRNKVKFLYVLSKICAKNNFLTVCFFKLLSHGVKRERRSALELRNKVSS